MSTMPLCRNLYELALLSRNQEQWFVDRLINEVSNSIMGKTKYPLQLAYSLGWIGSEFAQEQLVTLTNSNDPFARAAAIFVLGQISEIQYQSIIKRDINDKDIFVANIAQLTSYWGGGIQCAVTTPDINNIKTEGLLNTYYEVECAIDSFNRPSSLQNNKSKMLIGVSGSGKTYILNKITPEEKYEAIDLDTEVEQLTNEPLENIFIKYGESVYRAIERVIILKLLNTNGLKIIALGGGSIANKLTYSLISKNFSIIHLSASYKDIDSRLNKSINSNKAAKLLTVTMPSIFHEMLYYYRDPYYASIADRTINTSSLTPEHLMKSIFSE